MADAARAPAFELPQHDAGSRVAVGEANTLAVACGITQNYFSRIKKFCLTYWFKLAYNDDVFKTIGFHRKARWMMTDGKSNLRKNFDWYYANLQRLLPKYRGRFIAFADGKVIGAYDSMIEAARAAIDLGYPLGTFAVHECIPKKDERPVVIASRIADFSKVSV